MNDSVKPSYMNLGAPRDRDHEDYFEHQINMNKFESEKEEGAKKQMGKAKTPRLSFKMIKTDIYSMSSPYGYVKWIAVAAFLGVSVASFLTQSTLFIFDKISGDKISGKTSENVTVTQRANGRQTGGQSTNQTNRQERSLGSDDATANASSTLREPQYRLENEEQFPRLTAKSYLVADMQSGEIVKVLAETDIHPLASVSKLMTALIATEKMDMQKIAIVSRDSYNTYGSEGGLLLGEKIRLADLMYPLLMESSNDAAEVIADAYDKGHTAFLAEMNKKAEEIGMVDTYYEDPSGLSEKNTSSVDDQFLLLKYIYDNHKEIFDKTRVRQYEILKHKWYNKNRLLNQDTFIGGKNGYIDESKWTTASMFEIPLVRGGKRPIGIILLKSLDREGDTLKVINFLKKNAYFAE